MFEDVIEAHETICEGRMQVLRISDWTRLVRQLPPQCTPTDVRKVFYPKVPSYDPINARSTRDDTFLALFDDAEYHAAYRRVQNALPRLKFHNIRTILTASAQEGVKVTKLMCHIVQWFDPSFEIGRGLQLWERLNLDESEDRLIGRKIQLAIFEILRGRTKELDTTLLMEFPSAEPATYLKRFDTPSIWSEVLQKVKELTNTPLRGPFEGVGAGDADGPGTPGSAMPQSSQATFPSTAAVVEQAFQRTWETTISIRKHPVLGRPEAATALLRKIAEWKNEQYSSFEREESQRGPKRRRFQEEEAEENGEDEEEAENGEGEEEAEDDEDEEEADEDEEENSEVENGLIDMEAESEANEESHRQILSSERDSDDEDLLPGEE
jgi:hypothetical protein